MTLPISKRRAGLSSGAIGAVLVAAVGFLVGPEFGRADGPATTGPAARQVGDGSGPATTRPAGLVSIYGTRFTDARRVIFMVDTSGSMIGVFGDLKANLKKTVIAMKSTDDQKLEFDIITFSDENEPRIFSRTVGDKSGPVPATNDNKQKAVDFIDDLVASGGTLPMPAIKAALAIDPPADGIFFLTDGLDNVASFEDISGAFKEATKDGKLKVNCVHFVSDPDPKLVEVLKEIADESHGEFKQIQKSDMQ